MEFPLTKTFNSISTYYWKLESGPIDWPSYFGLINGRESFASLLHTLPHYSTNSLTTPHTPSLLHTLPHYSTNSLTTPHTPSLLHRIPHYTTDTLTTPQTPSLLHTLSHCTDSLTTPQTPSLHHRLLHYSTHSVTTPHTQSLLHTLSHYSTNSLTTPQTPSLLHKLSHYSTHSLTTPHTPSLLHILHTLPHYSTHHLTTPPTTSLTTLHTPSPLHTLHHHYPRHYQYREADYRTNTTLTTTAAPIRQDKLTVYSIQGHGPSETQKMQYFSHCFCYRILHRRTSMKYSLTPFTTCWMKQVFYARFNHTISKGKDSLYNLFRKLWDEEKLRVWYLCNIFEIICLDAIPLNICVWWSLFSLKCEYLCYDNCFIIPSLFRSLDTMFFRKL